MRAVALLLLLALAVGSVSAVAAKIPREKIVSRSENENEAGITTGSDELAVETTTGAVPETIIQPTTAVGVGETGLNNDGNVTLGLEAGSDGGGGSQGETKSTSTQVLALALCLTLLVSAVVVVTRQRTRSRAATEQQQRNNPIKLDSVSPGAPLPVLTPGPNDDDIWETAVATDTRPNELYIWETAPPSVGGTKSTGKAKGTKSANRRKSRLSAVMNPSVFVPRSPTPEDDFAPAATAVTNGSVYFIPRSPDDVPTTDDVEPEAGHMGAVIMERSPVAAAPATPMYVESAAPSQTFTMRSPIVMVEAATAAPVTAVQGLQGQSCTARSPIVPQQRVESVYNLIPKPSPQSAVKSETPTQGLSSYFMMRSPVPMAHEIEPEEPQQVFVSVSRSPVPTEHIPDDTPDEHGAYFTMRSPTVAAASIPVPEPVQEEEQGQAFTSRSPTVATPKPQRVAAISGSSVMVRSPLVPRSEEEAQPEQHGQACTARSPVVAQAAQQPTVATPGGDGDGQFLAGRSPVLTAVQRESPAATTGGFGGRSPAGATATASAMQTPQSAHRGQVCTMRSPAKAQSTEATEPTDGYVTIHSPVVMMSEPAAGEAHDSPYEPSQIGMFRSPINRVAAEAETVSPDTVMNPFMPTTIERAVDPRRAPQDPVSAVRTTTQLAAYNRARALSPQMWAQPRTEVTDEADESLPIGPEAMEAAEELMTFMMSSLPKSPALYGTPGRDQLPLPSPLATMAAESTVSTQTPVGASESGQWAPSPATTEHSFMQQAWSPIVNEPPTPNMSEQGTPGVNNVGSSTKATSWAPFFRPSQTTVSVYPPLDISGASTESPLRLATVERVDVSTTTESKAAAFYVPLDPKQAVEWGPKFFTPAADSPVAVRKAEAFYVSLSDDEEEEREIIEPEVDESYDIYKVDQPIVDGRFTGELPNTPLQIVGNRVPGLQAMSPMPAARTPSNSAGGHAAATPAAVLDDGFKRPIRTMKKAARPGEVPMTAPRQGNAERLLQFWSPWARGAPDAMDYDPVTHTPAQPRNPYQRPAGLAFPSISEDTESETNRPAHFQAQDTLLNSFRGLPSSPQVHGRIEELDASPENM